MGVQVVLDDAENLRLREMHIDPLFQALGIVRDRPTFRDLDVPPPAPRDELERAFIETDYRAERIVRLSIQIQNQ
jgi:hypothetical protein